MKTSFCYLYIFLLIVISAACKKESAGNNAPQKLKSYTEEITVLGGGHTVETFNISYDAQDRITSVVSTTKPGHRLVYQYSNENQFTFDKYEDNKVTLHNTYYINGSLSLIDSTYQYNIQRDTSSVKYMYDSDKKLVKQKQYILSYLVPPVLYNTVTFQYDLKGTLTKESDNYHETTYGYDEHINNTVQTEPFYFPFKQQLPTHTFTIRFGTTITTEHIYAFDSNNRVIKETAKSNDGKVAITTYTYQ